MHGGDQGGNSDRAYDAIRVTASFIQQATCPSEPGRCSVRAGSFVWVVCWFILRHGAMRAALDTAVHTSSAGGRFVARGRFRAAHAGLLSVALVAQRPAGTAVSAASVRAGHVQTATTIAAIPPSRIPVKEPTRVKVYPLRIEAMRRTTVRGVRPMRSICVAGLPMLHPSEIERRSEGRAGPLAHDPHFTTKTRHLTSCCGTVPNRPGCAGYAHGTIASVEFGRVGHRHQSVVAVSGTKRAGPGACDGQRGNRQPAASG